MKSNLGPLFLREFTKELILNSRKGEKREFLRDFFPYHPIKLTETATIPIAQIQITPQLLKIIPTIAPTITITPKPTPISAPTPANALPIAMLAPKPVMPVPIYTIRPSAQPQIRVTQQPTFPQPPTRPSQILPVSVIPETRPIPIGFTLNKLDVLISDNKVMSIECSGPNKVILVRTFAGVSATKIILSEEEIKKIISAFAEAARVPLIGGVVKAAVGNLIITAVISDFVGSRFIITKTFYFITH